MFDNAIYFHFDNQDIRSAVQAGDRLVESSVVVVHGHDPLETMYSSYSMRRAVVLESSHENPTFSNS